MSAPAKELNEYSARLATFKTPHHLGKRRASAQKKKNASTVEWPHEYPSAEGLARAGFYYKPASDSEDNVQCFSCNVKLDGWEPADDPISEHLAHSKGCAWATAISVIRDEDSQQEPEQRDPLSEEMANARHATFHSGDGWPHEGKKGWKCKISKMVEAGWAWDPNDESEDRDGVTCFYCNLSLDGWEPKDDPFVEHKRREPGCQFFILLEHYHGTEVADGKSKKGKARGKAAARSSTASKASRMSAQSTMSEVPSMGASFADLGVDGSLAGADDSIVTTATTASQATTTGAAKGRKKAAAKPKATAKGTKGKKKAPVDEDAMEVNYPELNSQKQHAEEEEMIFPAPPKAKPTRKAAKAAPKQLDSSVVEISHMDIAPPKKATRGRKPKVQPQPEPEPVEIPQTPDAEAIAEKRLSEISAQLQDELDHTVDDMPLDQSTPVAVEAPKPKRGVKRTSDGARKQQSSDSSAFEIDVPALPKAPPVAKAKPGRKPKQTSNASTEAEQEIQPPVEVEDMRMDVDVEQVEEPEPEPAPKKARGRPKGSKNSSARSSHASTTMIMEPDAQPDELEAHQNEPEPVTKKARGRPKGSKNSSARSSLASMAYTTASEPEPQPHEEVHQDEPEVVTKKARGRPKGSKNSSARSSLASQPPVVASEPEPEPEPQPEEELQPEEPEPEAQPEWPIIHQDEPELQVEDELQPAEPEAQPEWPIIHQDEPENLARDEQEIESELRHMASEQSFHDAMEIEQDQANEFEASPSEGRTSKDSREIQQLEQELQKETENPTEKTRELESPPRLSLGLGAENDFTFSPTGSDKENQPSSVVRQPLSAAKQPQIPGSFTPSPNGSSDKENQPSAVRPPPSSAKQPQQAVFMSPTKTTRIPLAPGTPNRSPTKLLMSPSKAEISQLKTTVPWKPIDMDTIFLAEPQNTPGRVGQQLAEAAGTLTNEEKKMTLEQWVRYQAEKHEEELKRTCEMMVAAFEREGLRALESLNGIETVG